MTTGRIKRCRRGWISRQILGLLLFALCFLPPAARSLKRTKKTQEERNQGFRTLGPFLRLRRSKFLFGICHKIAGIYHVLSVSVVPSVSVESVIESVML